MAGRFRARGKSVKKKTKTCGLVHGKSVWRRQVIHQAVVVDRWRSAVSPYTLVFDTEKRIRINQRMRHFVTIGLWVVCWVVAHAQQPKTEYLRSERGDAQRWTGPKWTPEEAALFGGMPRHTEVRQHLLVLRYSFYVSHSDAE